MMVALAGVDSMEAFNYLKHATPKRYDVFAVLGWGLFLEKLFKRTMVCEFEKDIASIALFEAPIEAYDTLTG
jgi:hypothetical protein